MKYLVRFQRLGGLVVEAESEQAAQDQVAAMPLEELAEFFNDWEFETEEAEEG